MTAPCQTLRFSFLIRKGIAFSAVFLGATCLISSAWGQGETPTPPSWNKLKAVYASPTIKSPEVKEESVPDDTFTRTHLSFTNARGETVAGLYLRPRGEGTYPVVLLLHGLGSDKDAMIRWFGRQFAQKGVACLAIDAPRHGERRKLDTEPTMGSAFVQIISGGVKDWRPALDWLLTRKEVDPKHIGLLGYSMGSMMGSILGGVEERISAVALCVGGDPVRDGAGAALPEPAQLAIASASPSLYVSHISPRPVLFINAKGDRLMPRAAAERLQDAARKPKTILWVDGGHILAPEDAIKAVDWLAERLTGKMTP